MLPADRKPPDLLSSVRNCKPHLSEKVKKEHVFRACRLPFAIIRSSSHRDLELVPFLTSGRGHRDKEIHDEKVRVFFTSCSSVGMVGADYAPADGSATAGSDYRAVSGRLSFTDGEVSKTFSIEIMDDADYEGDETLNLTLSNPSGGAGLGAPAIASLLLIENETSEPVDNNASSGGGGGVDLITLLLLISLGYRNLRIRSYVCH